MAEKIETPTEEAKAVQEPKNTADAQLAEILSLLKAEHQAKQAKADLEEKEALKAKIAEYEKTQKDSAEQAAKRLKETEEKLRAFTYGRGINRAEAGEVKEDDLDEDGIAKNMLLNIMNKMGVDPKKLPANLPFKFTEKDFEANRNGELVK